MSDLKNMQPIEAFVEHYMPTSEWTATKEFIVYNHSHHRFRIIVETPDMMSVPEGFIGLWRQDELAEAGINVDCDDAKEFAQALLNTMFYHLSPHETMHVVDALEKDLDEWHEERSAAFPETAADGKRCKY